LTALFALVLVFVGLIIAVNVLKFTVKVALIGGVAALVYLVVMPHLERLM
jgi:hypothetical protein